MLEHPTIYTHFGFQYLSPVKNLWRKGFHPGLDYNNGATYADLGQGVYSFGKGTVVHAKNMGMGWGNVIVIEHRFTDENGNNRTVWGRYAHLQKMFVRKGDTVEPGQWIANLGNTGTQYPHLHFDVFKFDPKGNFGQYTWGKTRDWVKERYANIEFMVANWQNA